MSIILPYMDTQQLRLEFRSPSELGDNPKNWRQHPAEQMRALDDVLKEVGWAGVILFNERTGRIIDGHARKKVAVKRGHDKVPVLIGDWSEADEAKILATLDPLGGMADANADKLEALLREVKTSSPAIADMLAATAKKAGAEWEKDDWEDDPDNGPQMGTLEYRIIVQCDDEADQAKLLERLEAEGRTCQVLMS